jgi:hypothetical protein
MAELARRGGGGTPKYSLGDALCGRGGGAWEARAVGGGGTICAALGGRGGGGMAA